jgi:hypothetical protein
VVDAIAARIADLHDAAGAGKDLSRVAGEAS